MRLQLQTWRSTWVVFKKLHKLNNFIAFPLHRYNKFHYIEWKEKKYVRPYIKFYSFKKFWPEPEPELREPEPHQNVCLEPEPERIKMMRLRNTASDWCIQAGVLLYCQSRQDTTCCFDKHECTGMGTKQTSFPVSKPTLSSNIDCNSAVMLDV
jgi:hypothetical protein